MVGKKSSTRIANSYGYGKKSQTSARSKLKKKRTRRAQLLAPYKSQYEQNVAAKLEEKGVAFEYEPKQIKYIYPTKRGICQACGSNAVGRLASYTPDFWLPELGIWVEAKGKWDSAGRTKILAVLASDNELTKDNFKMLFMYDNWVTRNKTMRYTGWCDKQFIDSAVGVEMPKEWLKL